MISKKLSNEVYKILETENLKLFKEETKGKEGKEFFKVLSRYRYGVLIAEDLEDKIRDSSELEDKIIEYLDYHFKKEDYLTYELDGGTKYGFKNFIESEIKSVISILLKEKWDESHDRGQDISCISKHGGQVIMFGYGNKEYLYVANYYTEYIYLVKEDDKEEEVTYLGIREEIDEIDYYYDLFHRGIFKRKLK